MSFKNRLVLLGAASVALGLFAQACATEVTGDDDPAVDAGVDSGKKDGAVDAAPADSGPKDAGSDGTVADTGTDSGPADSGPVDSGAVDSGPDAGPNRPGDLFDPTAPKEGDACPAGTVENGVIERSCGYCGTQKAFCTNAKVGAYGPCLAEHTDANRCLPNATRGVACGICGTAVDDCDPGTCTWNAGACMNELANGCTAGEVTYITGVCANPDDVRKQVCSPQCALLAPEPCAPQPIDTIDLPTDGSTKTAVFTFGAATAVSKYAIDNASFDDSFACPTPDVHTATPAHFALVRNTTNAPVVVETWPSKAANGTNYDTVSIAYAGRASIPKTDAELKACTGVSNDTCTTSPCAGTSTTWSGLANDEAFLVPANGTAIVHTAQYSGTTAAGQPFQFNVRVQPAAVRPAIDHTITIPAVGASVNQALDFATANTTKRLYTAFADNQVCPIAPSATVTPYRYLKLNNATAAARTVEVSVGGDGFDGIIASYARADAPVGAERNACVGSANDTCSNAAYDACLNGANAVVIPANGSAVVYVAEYFNDGTAPTAVIKTTN